MSKSRRYYWLKLPIDFFDDDAIEWLEEQENGKVYCSFYLKLCLRSINSEGILIRKIGNALMPYDEKKLSEITKTPIDTTIIALELLKAIGLVEILDGGEIKLPKVPEMVGSETGDAKRKREKRNKNKSTINGGLFPDNVRLLCENCPPEKEKEKEIEKELLLRNNNSFSKCEMPNEIRAKIDEIFKGDENL